MTERLNTTSETAESSVFSTSAEWYAQVVFAGNAAPTAIVDILVSADGVAPYQSVTAITPGTVPPLKRLAPMPFVKMQLRGNTGGGLLKAWSSE